MVLVGKVNKDIVLRINRHGQPAVGLCGDDGLLFRVATHGAARAARTSASSGASSASTPASSSHIAADYIPVIASVGADREGRSHNVNADEAAGAVARALGAYKVMFLTDVAGLAARPGRPGVGDLRDGRRRGRGRAGRRSPAACARSSRRAWTRSTAASAYAHIVDGRVPHSLLLELFTDAGIGTKIRPGAVSRRALMRQLRALPGRVRARRGRAAVGRRGRRVPRLPRRHLGLQRRALPPARGRGGRRSRPRGSCTSSNLFCNAPMVRARRAARARARSAARVLLQLAARRPTRRRSSSPARRGRGGEIVVLHGGFHGRTYGALSATPQESKQAPFAPLVPGFRPVAADAEAIAAAVDDGTAAVLIEPIQGESGVHPSRDELLRAARAACDARRRGADLRRGPDRHGADRHAVGLRAAPASCPTR